MKRLLVSFMAIGSVALLILPSCKKSDLKTVNANPKSSALTVNTTTPVLDKTKLTDTTAVVMFNFTAPAYDYKAVVANSLQIDAAGDNWKNPTTAALGSSGSHGYSTAAFNALLLKLNLPAGVASQVNVRVVNALSSDVASYSNVVNLTVTPFNLISFLYVPGDYEGWGNPGAQEDSLVSPTGNGVYTGIVDFTGYAGSTGSLQFKLVPVKGSWTNSYGTFDSGTNKTIVYDGNNDGNLWVPTAAKYLLTVNTNTNTISAQLCDYYSVIGDAAQGWGTDIGMKFINDGNNNWVVKLPLVSTGSFKVRQDDAWTNSWGLPKATSAGYGIANTLNDSSNNNISVATSGTYTVSFNMQPSPFGNTAFPNSTAPVTTTYSVQ